MAPVCFLLACSHEPHAESVHVDAPIVCDDATLRALATRLGDDAPTMYQSSERELVRARRWPCLGRDVATCKSWARARTVLRKDEAIGRMSIASGSTDPATRFVTISIVGPIKRKRTFARIAGRLDPQLDLDQLYANVSKDFDVLRWDRGPERGVLAVEATCATTPVPPP